MRVLVVSNDKVKRIENIAMEIQEWERFCSFNPFGVYTWGELVLENSPHSFMAYFSSLGRLSPECGQAAEIL